MFNFLILKTSVLIASNWCITRYRWFNWHVVPIWLATANQIFLLTLVWCTKQLALSDCIWYKSCLSIYPLVVISSFWGGILHVDCWFTQSPLSAALKWNECGLVVTEFSWLRLTRSLRGHHIAELCHDTSDNAGMEELVYRDRNKTAVVMFRLATSFLSHFR